MRSNREALCDAPHLPEAHRITSVGIGTFYSQAVQVAGFHRARPSTTLDKRRNI